MKDGKIFEGLQESIQNTARCVGGNDWLLSNRGGSGTRGIIFSDSSTRSPVMLRK